MGRSRSYKSKKALGQLFDRVASAGSDYVPRCEDQFDARITDKFDLDQETLVLARGLKAQYDVAVRRLLKQHRIATEFELYSGWAMSKPAVGSDYKRQEDLGQQFDTLKQRFRELCVEAAGSSLAGGGGGGGLERLVAAMYVVTRDEVQAILAEHEGEDLQYSFKDMPLISFPWIFHWVLVKMAMGTGYKVEESVLAPKRVVSVNALPKLDQRQPDQRENVRLATVQEPPKLVEEKADVDIAKEEPEDLEEGEVKEDPRLQNVNVKQTAAARLLKLLDSDSDSD